MRCRWLYNGALEERRNHYKKYGKSKKSPTRYDQQKSLTEIRRDDPDWAGVPVAVLRSSLARLDKAYKAFVRRCKSEEKPGFPRFKGKVRYDSFDLQSQVPRIENSRVHFPKLGPVKFHEYRPLPAEPIQDIVVHREAKGWTVSFICDLGAVPPKKADPREAVGLDLGLKEFAILSDGSTIANPRHGKAEAQCLARRQRRLARRKKGSKSRQRAKLLVRKSYERIANQRKDFARKQAKNIVERFDVISHEDLQIRNMVRGNLAKSINDAAWGIFLGCLRSKAEEAGKVVIGVNPRGTSQKCSGCSDLNAAINIHELGMTHFWRQFREARGSLVVDLTAGQRPPTGSKTSGYVPKSANLS